VFSSILKQFPISAAFYDVHIIYYGTVRVPCIEYVIRVSLIIVIVSYGLKMFFITDIEKTFWLSNIFQ
jgi:hypothetical protein